MSSEKKVVGPRESTLVSFTTHHVTNCGKSCVNNYGPSIVQLGILCCLKKASSRNFLFF